MAAIFSHLPDGLSEVDVILAGGQYCIPRFLVW
jgi:hypothetical protein